MKIHNPVAKHLHKANNINCFHEEKRDKLLSDAVNKELDESVFNGLESLGNDENVLDDLAVQEFLLMWRIKK